jgi:hypothetical protein
MTGLRLRFPRPLILSGCLVAAPTVARAEEPPTHIREFEFWPDARVDDTIIPHAEPVWDAPILPSNAPGVLWAARRNKWFNPLLLRWTGTWWIEEPAHIEPSTIAPQLTWIRPETGWRFGEAYRVGVTHEGYAPWESEIEWTEVEIGAPVVALPSFPTRVIPKPRPGVASEPASKPASTPSWGQQWLLLCLGVLALGLASVSSNHRLTHYANTRATSC